MARTDVNSDIFMVKNFHSEDSTPPHISLPSTLSQLCNRQTNHDHVLKALKERKGRIKVQMQGTAQSIASIHERTVMQKSKPTRQQ